MSQTLSLYRLQQVDNKLDRIQARLKDIHQLMNDNTELNQAQELSKSADGHFFTATQTLKSAEQEVQEQRVKIEQTESSLFGGINHSPKELIDLQNDVAALKRHLVRLEDAQLDAMQVTEDAEKTCTNAKADWQHFKDKFAEQNQILSNEQLTLQKELEKLGSERTAIAGAIPQTAIEYYDRLRLERRGVAVAAIVDNSCAACGAALSPSQVQAAHASEQMASCPSCDRILYGS